MAAIAGHHWVVLVIIASAAGEVTRDPATAGNATTIKLITARCPLLTRPGWTGTEQTAEGPPASGPYRVASAEGVHCQLNSRSSVTSKTLPLPPSSTAVQGMGGIQAAVTPTSDVCKPGNIHLAWPAPTGQPHEMIAHHAPRSARQAHGESPSRGQRAINNSTLPPPKPYTVAHPDGCCLLGPTRYRGRQGTCNIRIKKH